ncbi:MAG: tetratricopeptide repeat protein [Planctomycetota bacterium]
MNNNTRFIAGRLTSVLLLVAVGYAWAYDEVVDGLPSPFIPAPVQPESIGAKWRHGFHKMRTTWDKYFEVYGKDLDGFEPSTLDKVRAETTFYMDQKLQLDVYFAKIGSFFRPFATPFDQSTFVNFSAWSYSAELWTKDGRGSIHPLFYVDKLQQQDLIKKISHLPMYTPIHLWVKVCSKSERLAWLEVVNLEIIPETAQNNATLRHIELGANQLAKKRYDLAAQSLEAAVKLGIPVQVETKIYAMLGRAYYELRQYSLARNALVNAVMRDEGNIKNLILLARTDLRIGYADEARQSALRALTLEPSNPEARAEFGLSLALLGDILSAHKELDYAQRLAPHNQLPEAHRNRAMAMVLENKFDVAEAELSKALLLRPMNFCLQVELGDIYLMQNKRDKALSQYTQAKELASHWPEPYYKIALVLKSQADDLTKENKADEAKNLYKEALKNASEAIAKDPTFIPAYALEIELMRITGAKNEMIKKKLDNGAKVNLKSALMQETIFEQARIIKDWTNMERATRNAIAIKPAACNYSRLGHVLANRPNPDYSAAVEAYAEALRLAPDRADDLAALGQIRVRYLADAIGAESVLMQAVKLQPKNAEAWYDLALARRALEKYVEALAAADETVRLTKSVPSCLLAAQIRIDRHKADDLNVALSIAQAALADAANDNDKAQAASVLGAALLHTGKILEALEAFKSADALMKDNPEHNLWYGVALFKNGDLTIAQERLQMALTTQPAPSKRIQVAAQKTMKNLTRVAKSRTKSEVGQSEIAKKEEQKSEKQEATTAKNLPPVIEEEESVPVPIEVPGSR